MNGNNIDRLRLNLLKKYFLSREDALAAGQDGRFPRPVRPMSLDAYLVTHLRGEAAPNTKVQIQSKRGSGWWSGHFRAGSYAPNEDGFTPWICIDFDGKASSTGKKGRSHSSPLADPKAVALQTYHKAVELGLSSYLELSASTSGWHLWILLQHIQAWKARLVAYHLVPEDAKLVDGSLADPHSAKGIEVFPKQDRIKKNGYGNMVWLPWWEGSRDKGGNEFYRLNDKGELEVYMPDDFTTNTEEQLDEIISKYELHQPNVKPRKSYCANPGKNISPSNTANTTSTLPESEKARWRDWRDKALSALTLETVYGNWLTGNEQGPGWLECRDPASPTGDRNPSAGVATGEHGTVRGQFKSFRDGRILSVFDFLINHNGCSSFSEAVKFVAEKSGIPLPATSLPEIPPGFLDSESTSDPPVTEIDAMLTEMFGPGSPPTPAGDSKTSEKEDEEESEPLPHELARLYIDKKRRHTDAHPTIVYHKGEYWIWEEAQPGTGYAYRFIEEDTTLRAEMSAFAEPYLFNGVTKAKISNALQALSGICLLPDTIEKPCWLSNEPKNEISPPVHLKEWFERLKANGRYVSLSNGIFDLFAWVFNDNLYIEVHHPRWFSTVVLPYRYDPQATCERWLKFLNEIFQNHPECIPFLQEWMGYLLIPGNWKQKFLMLKGQGSNGKSVVLETIKHLVGKNNCSHVPLSEFMEKFSGYEMIDKLVNIDADVEEIPKIAEGRLKILSASDTAKFETKYKRSTFCEPTAKLIFSANELPRFSDRTNALWRRLIVLPFDIEIPDSDKDEFLKEKLQDEISGIFNWALAGLKRLISTGQFSIPSFLADEVKRHRMNANPVWQFLDEHVVPYTGGFITCKDLYTQYKFWTADCGYNPMGRNKFLEEVMTSLKIKKSRKRLDVGQVWILNDIIWKSEEQPDMDSII